MWQLRSANSVRLDKQRLLMPANKFRLLSILIANAGRVANSGIMSERIWEWKASPIKNLDPIFVGFANESSLTRNIRATPALLEASAIDTDLSFSPLGAPKRPSHGPKLFHQPTRRLLQFCTWSIIIIAGCFRI